MPLPEELRQQLEAELEFVRQEKEHQLPLPRRLALYDALGDTFPELTALAPARRLQEGIVSLTVGDRVRARLAILTARKVLPLWYEELNAAGLLAQSELDRELCYLIELLIEERVTEREQERLLTFLDTEPINQAALRAAIAALSSDEVSPDVQQIMLETIDSSLVTDAPAPALSSEAGVTLPVWRKPLATVWTKDIPAHLLLMAEAVLQGGADIHAIFAESCEAHTILGNYFGYDEEEFPERAYLAAEAALEALNMALGLGWYKTFKVDKVQAESERLMGRGPAEQMAASAYSVEVDKEGRWLADPERLLAFWEWWLTEAIPAAWESET